MPRPLAALIAALVVALSATGARAASAPAVFDGQALWVNQLPAGATPAMLAGTLAAAGSRTVYVKAADGTSVDRQFTPMLVASLHSAGLRVCAWTVIYGDDPLAEAALAAAAAHAGTDCVIYDAEGPYDGRYSAAQQFMGGRQSARAIRSVWRPNRMCSSIRRSPTQCSSLQGPATPCCR